MTYSRKKLARLPSNDQDNIDIYDLLTVSTLAPLAWVPWVPWNPSILEQRVLKPINFRKKQLKCTQILLENEKRNWGLT